MPSPMNPARLDPGAVRRLIVDQAHRTGVGHIGSALSVTDLVVAVRRVLQLRGGGPDRDRFVLSNGHTALALYCALHVEGLLAADLDSYCRDGSLLGVHPQHALPAVDFTTGSLGMGLSFGAGAALAARLAGSSRRAYVIMSDAEMDEGSVWEAAAFAAHQGLSNLVGLVDCNGQQALGRTDEVIALRDLAARWRAFGWDAQDVDGHDVDGLEAALGAAGAGGRPTVLVAHTVFGRGVSFMQSKVEWHYRPLTDDLHATAVAELEAACAARS